MSTSFVSINEASYLVNKSTQTIRRLIKLNKLKFRRKRTPQGFNYFIDRDSLIDFYRLPGETPSERFSSSFSDVKLIPEEYKSDQSDVTDIRTDSQDKPLNLDIEDVSQPTDDYRLPVNKLNPDSQPAPIINQIVDSAPAPLPPHPLSSAADKKQPHENHPADPDPVALAAAIANQLEQKNTAVFAEFQKTIQHLISQHSKDKEQLHQDKEELYKIAKMLQDRVIILEDHIKQLRAPDRKWYEFWKY